MPTSFPISLTVACESPEGAGATPEHEGEFRTLADASVCEQVFMGVPTLEDGLLFLAGQKALSFDVESCAMEARNS